MHQILASIAHTLPLSSVCIHAANLAWFIVQLSVIRAVTGSLAGFQHAQRQPKLVFSTAPCAPGSGPGPGKAAAVGAVAVANAAPPLRRSPRSCEEAEEVYKKLFGRYPSRQGLVCFCAEVLRINISPFLPKQLPERSSLARRSLSELNSLEMSPVAESSQCWVCGSPMGKRGRCQKRLPSTNNFCLSSLFQILM
jgi:hypothetical protein